jgi:hypothetical protein
MLRVDPRTRQIMSDKRRGNEYAAHFNANQPNEIRQNLYRPRRDYYRARVASQDKRHRSPGIVDS